MAVHPLKQNAPATHAANGRGSAEQERRAVESRAHELFVARGCQHGHDLEDWLQAEREVRLERLRSGRAGQ